MSRNRAKFSPSEIRFSHDIISYKFRDGTLIQRSLEQLITGAVHVDDIPKIKIVRRDGLKFSVNNRRLWVFRKYEEFLKSRDETVEIPVTYGVHRNLTDFKLTTRDEGLTVRIRSRKEPDNTIRLKPSDIRYSRDAIYFRGGTDKLLKTESIYDILNMLENGIYTTDTLPRITVVQRRGKFFATENERVLWAIKEYSETSKKNITLTCNLGKYSDIQPTSFTTESDGLSVHVLSGYPKKKPKTDKCTREFHHDKDTF